MLWQNGWTLLGLSHRMRWDTTKLRKQLSPVCIRTKIMCFKALQTDRIIVWNQRCVRCLPSSQYLLLPHLLRVCITDLCSLHFCGFRPHGRYNKPSAFQWVSYWVVSQRHISTWPRRYRYIILCWYCNAFKVAVLVVSKFHFLSRDLWCP